MDHEFIVQTKGRIFEWSVDVPQCNMYHRDGGLFTSARSYTNLNRCHNSSDSTRDKQIKNIINEKPHLLANVHHISNWKCIVLKFDLHLSFLLIHSFMVCTLEHC